MNQTRNLLVLLIALATPIGGAQAVKTKDLLSSTVCKTNKCKLVASNPAKLLPGGKINLYQVVDKKWGNFIAAIHFDKNKKIRLVSFTIAFPYKQVESPEAFLFFTEEVKSIKDLHKYYTGSDMTDLWKLLRDQDTDSRDQVFEYNKLNIMYEVATSYGTPDTSVGMTGTYAIFDVNDYKIFSSIFR